jgi:hypothetical protein
MATVTEIVATALLSFHNTSTPTFIRELDAHGHLLRCTPVAALETVTVKRLPGEARIEDSWACDKAGAKIPISNP